MAKKDRTTETAKEAPPNKRNCGTGPTHERLLRTVPGYRQARDVCENHARRAALTRFVGRSGCTKIPAPAVASLVGWGTSTIHPDSRCHIVN